MYNILVPVDFSKSSFSAFYYAACFSELIPNSKITLLHVIDGSFSTHDVLVFEPLMSVEDRAFKRLKYFTEEYPKVKKIELPKFEMEFKIKFGLSRFVVPEYASQNNYDLIIMGTRDKHGLFDKIIGSTSAITLRKAQCPVILVHENVTFNKPEKIVFAFDQESDLEEALEDYRDLNNELKAKTDFVHVTDIENTDLSRQKETIVEELFEDNNPQFSFEIKTVEGENVHRTLQDYCIFKKADMLAMMHRQEGLLRRLFSTQNSVKMAQEFHLPVIVFHEKDYDNPN